MDTRVDRRVIASTQSASSQLPVTICQLPALFVGGTVSTVAFNMAIDPVLWSETHAFAQSSLGYQRLGVSYPVVNDDRSFNQGSLQSDPLV